MNRSILVVALLILVLLPQKALGIPNTSEGLGIIVSPDSPYIIPPRSLLVVGVFKDSPSYKKLHIGDLITKIDNKEIKNYTKEELFDKIFPKIPVKLTILRNGKMFDLTLSPSKVVYSPDNVAESFHKIGKFKGFESDNYFRSNLSRGDGIKVGDSFLIFEGEKYLGIATVKELNDQYSYLLINKVNGKIDSIYQYKYRLIYRGYYPPTGRHFSPKEQKEIEEWNKKWLAEQAKKDELKKKSPPKEVFNASAGFYQPESYMISYPYYYYGYSPYWYDHYKKHRRAYLDYRSHFIRNRPHRGGRRHPSRPNPQPAPRLKPRPRRPIRFQPRM